MQANTHAHQEFEEALLQRIANSDRFKMYQEAFRIATGLPLRLVSADPEGWCLDDQKINRSPFCEELNLCKSACSACLDTNRRLEAIRGTGRANETNNNEQSPARESGSHHCFVLQLP